MNDPDKSFSVFLGIVLFMLLLFGAAATFAGESDSVTVEYWRPCVGSWAPEVNGIKPGYFRKVPLQMSVDELRARMKLEQEQDYFDTMKMIGVPSIVVGLILFLAGLIISCTSLSKAITIGPEIAALGVLAFACGVCMVGWPLQIKWVAGIGGVLSIVWVFYRVSHGEGFKQKFITTVGSLEEAKEEVPDLWDQFKKHVKQPQAVADAVEEIQAKIKTTKLKAKAKCNSLLRKATKS